MTSQGYRKAYTADLQPRYRRRVAHLVPYGGNRALCGVLPAHGWLAADNGMPACQNCERVADGLARSRPIC